MLRRTRSNVMDSGASRARSDFPTWSRRNSELIRQRDCNARQTAPGRGQLIPFRAVDIDCLIPTFLIVWILLRWGWLAEPVWLQSEFEAGSHAASEKQPTQPSPNHSGIWYNGVPFTL